MIILTNIILGSIVGLAILAEVAEFLQNGG